MAKFFNVNKQDLTITYKPTGQVILFRGFDDPAKIASIRVIKGFLTDVYVEEAYEVKDYQEWRIADGSFRANKFFPDDLFIQITFCFNAWSKEHWLYEHFFKGRLEDNVEELIAKPYVDWCDKDLVIDYGKGLYLHTSTYKINEFRSPDYDIAMEQMRQLAPEIYKVEALGCWGNATASTYPEFNDSLIINQQLIMQKRFARYCIGIDTGLSNGQGSIRKDGRIKSAMTMSLSGLTFDYEQTIAIDEYFWTNEGLMNPKTEPELMREMVDRIIEWKEKKYIAHPDLMKGIITCYVDCADVGFPSQMQLVAREKGLMNIVFQPCTKKPIQTRVDFSRLLMAYSDFLVSVNCPNLIREIKASRHGEKGEVRDDIDDHQINAYEYSAQPYLNNLKLWKTFKEH